MNKGVLYCYKRDKSFRPILVCNVKRLPELGTDIEFIIGLSCFFLHFILSRCMIPGKIENWTNIFDFKGVGITQIPKKVMKGLNRPMADYFKGRLYRMHVVNA